MRFVIITASWNCMNYLPACITSVQMQDYNDYRHIVVDDASPGDGQATWIAGTSLKDRKLKGIYHQERMGALASQVEAIQSLNLDDEDVIVFLDGDDKLAHPHVLSHLVEYYESGVEMTYGSYGPDPWVRVPNPARAYDDACIRMNDYRNPKRWGIQFNHLRTLKYKLFNQLDHKVDLMDEEGKYYTCAGDTAVMIPCLEMAGSNHMFIPEVLLLYTVDSPHADWKTKAALIEKFHRRIFEQTPRKSIL